MSNIKVNTINDASGGSAAQLYGVSMRNGGTGWVNRIINGDMRIDQRNAGASVTANSSSSPFAVDRFSIRTNAGAYTGQQVADAPAGFVNSLKLTVTSTATLSASQFAMIRQIIEGFNIADLAWGTASAAPVSVSFWVKASVTGTYPIALINSSETRSYVATYTVNSANTWEYKTISVPGDTSGTWVTDNGNGIRVTFDTGSGSDFNGTANAWNSGWKQRTSGTVSLLQNSGATFYITGVQLEAGTVATPFERRDYGRELMMCQRYYQKTGSYFAITEPGMQTRTTGSPPLKVEMRASPTVTIPPSLAFHKPAVAFYSATSVFSGGSADGSGYVTVDIDSGAGTLTSGQMNNGLLYSAEL